MTQDQQLHIDSEILEATIEETANAGPGRGHIVDVTLIRAGTSSNGNHYPEQVLQDATVLFEGARAFADHKGPTDRAERSVRDLVGYYRQPRYELTPDGGRIRATFHLLPGNDWLWGIIQEATIEPGICGLSIDALGETKQSEVQGRSVRMVESVRKVKSVDIVTRPAAGGSLDRIVAGETGEVGDGEGGFDEPGWEDGDAHLASAVHESKGRDTNPGPLAANSGATMLRMSASAADSDVFNADEQKEFASVIRHHEGGRPSTSFPFRPEARRGPKSMPVTPWPGWTSRTLQTRRRRPFAPKHMRFLNPQPNREMAWPGSISRILQTRRKRQSTPKHMRFLTRPPSRQRPMQSPVSNLQRRTP